MERMASVKRRRVGQNELPCSVEQRHPQNGPVLPDVPVGKYRACKCLGCKDCNVGTRIYGQHILLSSLFQVQFSKNAELFTRS